DKELIAAFTDQEREFFDWYEANKGVLEAWNTPFKTVTQMMQKRWSKPDIYPLFLNWLSKWTGRVNDRMKYMMPSSELIDRICSTNILDSHSLLVLDSALE